LKSKTYAVHAKPHAAIDFAYSLNYNQNIVMLKLSNLIYIKYPQGVVQMFANLKRNIKYSPFSPSSIKSPKGLKLRRYFYTINYPTYEESLCKMEIKCLFGRVPLKKYFFSYHYVNPSRSPFIKQCLTIACQATTLDSLVEKIESDKVAYDNFKVRFVKFEDKEIEYAERLKAEHTIGYAIKGLAQIHDPEVNLGITKVNDKWFFGIYEKNKFTWKIHDNKPYNYSNSLSVRVAQAIINIAVKNNLGCKVVDPCCGIGTVVIEGLSQGIDIVGYEINPLIAEKAKKNLYYFEFEDVITNRDMHTIEDKYDVAIIDLPYGLFNPTTLEEQTALIRTARRISDKLVLVTMENMDEQIKTSGFNIVGRCHVTKGKFIRYITICE
jgi:tRNA (guanine10-N2)-dimethyltransferase